MLLLDRESKTLAVLALGVLIALIIVVCRASYNPSQELKAEISFWEQAKNLNTIAAFNEYNSQYPDGVFAEKASQNIEKIAEEGHTEKDSFANIAKGLMHDSIIASIAYNMRQIQGGSFIMGCTSEQGDDCSENELPTHRVTLTGYYINKYEVTQDEWKAIMGSNPSYFKDCDRCPVEQVSWNDTQLFLQKLNSITGKAYRLPSEAEWEFAARGGNKSNGFKFSGSDDVGSVSVYASNNGKSTLPVGSKQSNELGLFDMSGNLWEWCSDRYEKYGSIAQFDPQGASSGSDHVFRGGGWLRYGVSCRVSIRDRYSPDFPFIYVGFRLASSL